MKKPSSSPDPDRNLRTQIIGLGERSSQKSYYPELKKRLRELERFRMLLDCSSDLILLFDFPSGALVYCNNEVGKRLLWDRDALLQKTVFDLFDGDAVRRLMARFRSNDSAVSNAKTVASIFTNRNEPIPVEVSLSRVFEKDAAYVIAVVRDITERKMAEDALRESEAFLNALLDAVPIPVFYKDASGKYLGFNKCFETFFGADRESLIGKTVHEIYPSDLASIYSEKDRELFENEGVQHYESQIQNARGELRDVIFDKAVFYDRRGEVRGLIGTILDTTERKKLEEQLLQSKKMEAVGKLAGGVAHDFNNLLMVINGYSDFIFNRHCDDASIRDAAEEIHKAGIRAASLTKQLLAYSRKQVLSPKVLQLNTLLTDMTEMLKRLIGEDIDLNVLLNPNLGRIKADPTQIEQIVMNLIVNARDAMPGGGFLTIETQNVELDRSYVRSHLDAREGSYVMLAVTDNGQGMDKETVKNVFDPFFTTKTKDKGTGLGMSTVYGIVKQSDGHVNVYSELNRGTTVKVYLPRIEESSPVDAPVISQGSAVRGSETVLLVEDEDMVRNLVHRTLTRSGYTVLKAEDGLQAVQCMEECKDDVHILITDVVLPKMSGREIADVVTVARPKMKVLFMSGYTDNAIVHHGILDEGVNFIQKPFSPHDLLKRIRSILDSD